MDQVVTLTPNPAIDVSTAVDEIAPIRKLRCEPGRRDAGGGGINVARVVRRLGGEATAIYPAGGATGELLRRLVEREGVHSTAIATAEETREDFTVVETKTGHQYRFVLPGSRLSESEWRACLRALEAMEPLPPFVVGSGSLPPGVPVDFYAQAARIAKARRSKMVVDTSGDALAAALDEGICLLKPNLHELEGLVGSELADQSQQIEAARRLIEARKAEVIALTLGADGAILVTGDASYVARTPAIRTVNTVGAGDSFLGGMIWGLAAGRGIAEAFRYGVAAGTAAVMNQGTELCRAPDVARLYDQIELIPA